MRFILIALLALAYSFYPIQAAGVTAAATFQVENILPVISIGLYEDEDFDNARSGFEDNETGYARIEIIDTNGYRDVKKVEAKISGIFNTNETVDLTDYTNASFLSGDGSRATYSYEFQANGYEQYRLNVRVLDDEDQVVSSIDFTNNIDSGNQITGGAIAAPSRSAVLDFFRNLFSRLADLF